MYPLNQEASYPTKTKEVCSRSMIRSQQITKTAAQVQDKKETKKERFALKISEISDKSPVIKCQTSQVWPLDIQIFMIPKRFC